MLHEIEENYPLFSWSTGHSLLLDPVAISLHVGNAFPQPPSGIHVRFGFVEEMAELELEVWVDQPSTGERMSGRNNDTENRLTPLHHVQWVTGIQQLHGRTCVNAGFSHSLLTTDANEVTDYGLQVFTLDSSGELTRNHDTLFPDAVNCLHACMHAILYYMIAYVIIIM